MIQELVAIEPGASELGLGASEIARQCAIDPTKWSQHVITENAELGLNHHNDDDERTPPQLRQSPRHYHQQRTPMVTNSHYNHPRHPARLPGSASATMSNTVYPDPLLLLPMTRRGYRTLGDHQLPLASPNAQDLSRPTRIGNFQF